jgi:hypothetical protein
MKELVKVLMDKAGLSEADAKVAAEVVIKWLKHEENRKKVAGFTASAVAARVI